MAPGDAWNIYTGKALSPLRNFYLTRSHIGENTFLSWATIVDCGDVRMTPLDNTIALKQLDKAHQVRII
jgi:agmatinase